MALINYDKLSDAGLTFSQLPIKTQVIILVAIALSMSIGVMCALWIKQPNMSALYVNLDNKDTAEIIDMLQKSNYKYKVESTGIFVMNDQVHDVRMKVASMGLPKSDNIGYELFDKPQGFGSSQFSETVKYKRSIEGELAKTISSLEGVKTARVHIGIPRQSSFIQKNTPSSASIMVNLYPGTILKRNQINGIIHLVLLSIPGMNKESVSLVDQNGNLLSHTKDDKITMATEELGYANEKERQLANKIEELIAPIVGNNGVHAEVTAEFDFSYIEETVEQFDNNKRSVRNESIITEQKGQSELQGGIPGALSNQPPPDAKAQAKDVEDNATDDAIATKQEKPLNYRDRTNRQYELDRSVSYKKKQVGIIKKLSVAVLLNEKTVFDDKGIASKVKLTDDELKKIESLVKDSIGFNKERGDTISVVHSAFASQSNLMAVDNIEEEKSTIDTLLSSPIVYQIYKYSTGIICLLMVLFLVLRPIVKNLSIMRKNALDYGMQKLRLSEEKETLVLPEPDSSVDVRTDHIKKIAKDDSKRAAQVIMNWVEDDVR